jgi:Aspartyl protease
MNLTQTYAGRSRYYADRMHDQHLLFVSVACLLGNRRVDALIDTGSQWCVLTTQLADDLGVLSQSELLHTRLHTLFGSLSGRLVRFPVSFHADDGVMVDVDATWFVSDDWPGPPVIGWKGCLEQLRFALDPGDESFYFAEL